MNWAASAGVFKEPSKTITSGAKTTKQIRMMITSSTSVFLGYRGACDIYISSSLVLKNRATRALSRKMMSARDNSMAVALPYIPCENV